MSGARLGRELDNLGPLPRMAVLHTPRRAGEVPEKGLRPEREGDPDAFIADVNKSIPIFELTRLFDNDRLSQSTERHTKFPNPESRARDIGRDLLALIKPVNATNRPSFRQTAVSVARLFTRLTPGREGGASCASPHFSAHRARRAGVCNVPHAASALLDHSPVHTERM